MCQPPTGDRKESNGKLITIRWPDVPPPTMNGKGSIGQLIISRQPGARITNCGSNGEALGSCSLVDGLLCLHQLKIERGALGS